MSWLSPFLLGRPGGEYSFEISPEGMDIEEAGVVVLQRNLAGDLKKSTLKTSAPIIKVNSSFLSLTQRNQFASLVGIADTFLSFKTRNDWQVVDELVTILSSTTLQLANTSATRLSAVLVGMDFPSVITIVTPFKFGIGPGSTFGSGGFGEGEFGGGGETFDPGVITYNDVTRVITMTNALSDITAPLFLSYTYTGWLVNLERLTHRAQGGWLDRFQYDFQLTGV